MEILEKIFGGSGRVKVMRLFLFNPEKIYDRDDVGARAQIDPSAALRELKHLASIGFLKEKNFTKEILAVKKVGKDKRHVLEKKKSSGWHLDEAFPYLAPLSNLLIDLATLDHEEMLEQVKATGKMKLVVLAGIFIQDPQSRVDLFVVGDSIKRTKLESVIKRIEAEIGKEVRYAAFETSDFNYRLSVYDKLVRDILDYPHKKIFNKLGLR